MISYVKQYHIIYNIYIHVIIYHKQIKKHSAYINEVIY